MLIRTLLFLLLSTPALAVPKAVIHLEPYRDGVAMHANFGGHDGFFIFDIGGGISLLNPDFVANGVCKPWGRVTGYGMVGNRLDSPRCSDIALKVGGQTFNAALVGIYDTTSFFPKDAVHIDGLIGLNAFDGEAITIDFPAKTLTIESPSSLKQRIRGATSVPMRAEREAQGAALAVAAGVPTSNGLVWMELDSGNNRVNLISKPYAALFGLDPEKKERQNADFPIAGDIRVRSQVATPDLIIDGNLGMPFLKDIILTIDFRTNRMWMRQPKSDH